MNRIDLYRTIMSQSRHRNCSSGRQNLLPGTRFELSRPGQVAVETHLLLRDQRTHPQSPGLRWGGKRDLHLWTSSLVPAAVPLYLLELEITKCLCVCFKRPFCLERNPWVFGES